MGVLVGNALNHPLGKQVDEGFIEAQQAPVAQHLGEEAGIEKVEDRVFDPTHVLINRQPAVHSLACKRKVCVVGIAIAQEIPAGAHEGVHGVGLTLRWLAAAGAVHVHPAL